MSDQKPFPAINQHLPTPDDVFELAQVLTNEVNDPDFLEKVANGSMVTAMGDFTHTCQQSMLNAKTDPHAAEKVIESALVLFARIMARCQASTWAIAEFRSQTEGGAATSIEEKARQVEQASLVPDKAIDPTSPKARLIGFAVRSQMSNAPVENPGEILTILAETLHHEDPTERTFSRSLMISIQLAFGMTPTSQFKFFVENSEYEVEWLSAEEPLKFTHKHRGPTT